MNIEQMTQKTREALQAAQRIAVEYSNNAVEQEHLLAALAQQQDGLIPQLLQTLGIDANAFAQAALQKVEALPRVKKVFIRSGIRFDYLMADKSDDFFKKLVRPAVPGLSALPGSARHSVPQRRKRVMHLHAASVNDFLFFF